MSDPSERADESVSEVELMIRAAGSYVSASDDLRPRTMEAAREQSSEGQAQQTLANFGLAIGLAILLITPMIQQFSKLPVPVGLSSHEVQRRAVDLARGSSVEYHWAIVDIFSELRQDRDGS